MHNSLELNQIDHNRFKIINLPSNRSVDCIELFDLNGMKVMKVKEYKGVLDICILNQSIYFVRIQTIAGKFFTGKVVKN